MQFLRQPMQIVKVGLAWRAMAQEMQIDVRYTSVFQILFFVADACISLEYEDPKSWSAMCRGCQTFAYKGTKRVDSMPQTVSVSDSSGRAGSSAGNQVLNRPPPLFPLSLAEGAK